jgi:hypothetical protein
MTTKTLIPPTLIVRDFETSVEVGEMLELRPIDLTRWKKLQATPNYPSRRPDGHRIWRQVPSDDRIGADNTSPAYSYARHHHGIHPEPTVLFNTYWIAVLEAQFGVGSYPQVLIADQDVRPTVEIVSA